MKSIASLLFTVILFNQTIGFAHATDLQLSVVAAANTFTSLEQIETSIDQNQGLLKKIDLNENYANPTWSKKHSRKYLRWKNRLNQNINKIEMQITKQAEKDLIGKPEDEIAEFKSNLHQNLPQILDMTAKKIADSGGVLPFMLHSKKLIKELRHELKQIAKSKEDTSVDRSPASKSERETAANTFLILTILLIAMSAVFAVLGIMIVCYIAAGGAVLSGAALATAYNL